MPLLRGPCYQRHLSASISYRVIETRNFVQQSPFTMSLLQLACHDFRSAPPPATPTFVIRRVFTPQSSPVSRQEMRMKFVFRGVDKGNILRVSRNCLTTTISRVLVLVVMELYIVDISIFNDTQFDCSPFDRVYHNLV